MKRRGQNSLPQTDVENMGSPESGGPVFISVGFLRRPHGVRGEILMDLLTDFPERLRSGRKVYLGEAHESAVIASGRGHESSFLVTLRGVDDVDSAGKYRNTMVYVRTDELTPLPKGEYYHHQLIGLNVVDENDQPLGKLVEILETGANDVYVIRQGDEKEQLVPVIEGVILLVDLDKQKLHIKPPVWE